MPGQKSTLIVTGNIYGSEYQAGTTSIALNQRKKLIEKYGITNKNDPIPISVQSYNGIQVRSNLRTYADNTVYIACTSPHCSPDMISKFEALLDTFGTGTPVLVVFTERTAYVLKGLRDLNRLIGTKDI